LRPAWGLRRLGICEIIGTGPERKHGSSVYTDNDGDQIMPTSERRTESGRTETLVAGTGKFVSVSETTEWTVLQFPLKADEKLLRGVVGASFTGIRNRTCFTQPGRAITDRLSSRVR
jgi:hypothetical protein